MAKWYAHDARIAELAAAGRTQGEIARETGMAQGGVFAAVKRLGLVCVRGKCGRVLEIAHDARVRELAAAGKSRPEIAAHLGLSHAQVFRIAKRLGLVCRDVRGRQRKEKPPARVLEIVAARSRGRTCTDIARELGVTRQAVSVLIKYWGPRLKEAQP